MKVEVLTPMQPFTTRPDRRALINLFAALLASMAVLPIAATAQSIGTSCADCPSFRGAFSIENQTGTTIRYQYRWGNRHQWKEMTLGSGRVETHSYPLGEDRNGAAPTPYVRFDCIGGDGRVTPKEYRIPFHAVGYAGYGPASYKVEPKRFYFRYAPNGRTLDIFAR